MCNVLNKRFVVFILVYFSSNIALGEETKTEIKAARRQSKIGLALSAGQEKLRGDDFKSTSQINPSFKFYIEDKFDPNFYGETGKAVLSAFGGLSSRLDIEGTDMNAKSSSNPLVLEPETKTHVSTSSLSPMICVLSDTNFRVCPFLSIMSVHIRQKDASSQDLSTTGYGLDTSYRIPMEGDEIAYVGGLNWRTYAVEQKIHSQSSKFTSSRLALYAGIEF